VLDPGDGRDETGDVLVSEGIVSRAFAGSAGRRAEQVDGSGLWLLPGLVDMHAHLRVPGDEESETLDSGLRAAIAGGVTRVAAMPNTSPPLDDPALVSAILARAGALGLARVLPVACVSEGREGRRLSDMRALRAAGAVAFSDDGSPVRDDSVLAHALELGSELGCTIIEHPEDERLSRGGRLNSGEVARSLGDPGIPEDAEIADVRRCISILGRAGGSLHLTHLSYPESIEAVSTAAGRGLCVTADVTPHHLALDEGEVLRAGALAVVNPPLRSARSRRRLVELVRAGAVDAIASDHAPHCPSRKSGGPLDCAFGIAGLETMLPVVLEALLADRPDSPLAVLSLLTTGPCRILGLPAPSLREGSAAELVLFDPSEEWIPAETGTFSRSRNTPFIDRKLRGRVKAVWAGRLVYREGRFEKDR